MSGPLSAVASAVGVVQGLVDYYHTYRGQTDDIAHISKKLAHLRDTLESLHLSLQKRVPQGNDRDDGVISHIWSCMKDCEDPIQELRQKLEKFSTTSRKDAIASFRTTSRRLAYPFLKGTLSKLEIDIDDLIEQVSLGLQLLQQRNSEKLQDDVAAVLDLVGSMYLKSSIRSWLKAPDASINFNSAAKKRHPGTGLWFVEGLEFKRWLDTKASSFLWIVGFAGCGKSVLTSTAIHYAYRHRRANPNIGLAFFFFTFNDESKQDCSAMLRSLVAQLSNQLRTNDDAASRLCQSYNQYSPPDAVLLDCLRQLILEFSEGVYIVVDALDESPFDKHRDDVLQAISEMRKWGGLHLLVSSRDHSDIRREFSPLPKGCIIKMRNESVDEDIRAFVSDHLRSHRRFRDWADHFDEIENSLTSGAQGVFRWVECQFSALAGCQRSEYHLEKVLGSLPRTLGETYAQILRSTDPNCRDDVRRILNLLSCAKRPLLVEELIDALAVELDGVPRYNPKRRLKNSIALQQICAGLVEFDTFLTKDGDSMFEIFGVFWHKEMPSVSCVTTARIAHFSVQEYLESIKPCDSQDLAGFRMDLQLANDLMASICLTILLETPRHCSALGLVLHSNYPKRFWVTHYSECVPGPVTNHQAYCLFVGPADVFKLAFSHLLDDLDWHNPASRLYMASSVGLKAIIPELFLSYPPEASPNDFAQSALNEILAPQTHQELKEHLSQCRKDFNLLISERKVNIDTNALSPHTSPRLVATALCGATRSGHYDIVKLLLERAADPNMEMDINGTALSTASGNGRLDIVKILLDRGADINAYDPVHGAPLIHASARNNIEVARFLLEKGADPNVTYYFNDGPLFAATEHFGREDMVRLLLDKGADPNIFVRGHGTPVQNASRKGNQEVVKILLENGADPKIKDDLDYFGTALAAASFMGSAEILQLLLEHGAIIDNQEGNDGRKHLIQAVYSGNESAIKILVEAGAQVECRACDGSTPTNIAARIGYAGVVRMLIAAGASIDTQDELGKTPLVWAVCGGHVITARLLLENGALVETRDYKYGRTALLWGVDCGHDALVDLLVGHGASLDAQDHRGYTALTLAIFKNNYTAENILRRGGAVMPEDALGLEQLFLDDQRGPVLGTSVWDSD